MKRVSGLYEKIISIENLNEADKMARKGKGNSYGVRAHDENREANIQCLHDRLLNGEYKTSPYTIFMIKEPKERIIYRLPYYPDRIVHWAIMLQLEPIWMSVFTSDTYSCLKGRGIHGTAKKVNECLRNDPEGTQFCLKIDVHKFYPSIDHETLKKIVRKKIKDFKLLCILDEIIDSVPSGVPIGNYLSQYFANLYLSYFDHWVKEVKHVKYYFRYCDDMVFLAYDKGFLQTLLKDIKQYLKEGLKLELKGNYQVFPVASRGIDYVGYCFFHDHVLLRKRIKVNMMRKLSALKRKNIQGAERKRQIAAYWGWVNQPFASTHNLIKKLDYV